MNYLKLLVGVVGVAAEYGVEKYRDNSKKKVLKDKPDIIPIEDVDKLLEEVENHPALQYFKSTSTKSPDNEELDYRR